MTIQERLAQARAIHENAKAKGFHPCEGSGKDSQQQYRTEHYLMMIITELGEAINAHRKGKDAKRNKGIEVYISETKRCRGNFQPYNFEVLIKDTWQDELADVYIRMMDLAMKLLSDEELEVLKRKFKDIETFSEFIYSKSSLPQNTFTEKVFSINKLLDWNYNESEDDRNLGSYKEFAITLILIAMKIGELFNFDLDWHVAEKMKYNATRERLHGSKY